MKNYAILFFVICFGLSPLAAQENSVSKNDFSGCWQLIQTEARSHSQLTGYANCDSKAVGRKIEFNSYGEYRISNTTARGRCGTPSRTTTGRFSFDEESQVLKLFGTGNQKTNYWKITQLERGVYSIDQNFSQKSI